MILLFWWFAIINLSGDIELLSTHQTQQGCETVRNLYAVLNVKAHKITSCLEKL